MKNPGVSTLVTQLLVTSKSPSDDSSPIRTRAFLSQQTIDFDGTSFNVDVKVTHSSLYQDMTPVVQPKQFPDT